jgi:hypothetical protein
MDLKRVLPTISLVRPWFRRKHVCNVHVLLPVLMPVLLPVLLLVEWKPVGQNLGGCAKTFGWLLPHVCGSAWCVPCALLCVAVLFLSLVCVVTGLENRIKFI